MSDSVQLSRILAILMGCKVYDETSHLWRVFDQDENALVDEYGILLHGVHGFLLRTQDCSGLLPLLNNEMTLTLNDTSD